MNPTHEAIHPVKIYNYLTQEWVLYSKRFTQMTLEEAKAFIPQTELAQLVFDNEIANGKLPGIAYLLVISAQH